MVNGWARQLVLPAATSRSNRDSTPPRPIEPQQPHVFRSSAFLQPQKLVVIQGRLAAQPTDAGGGTLGGGTLLLKPLLVPTPVGRGHLVVRRAEGRWQG